MAHHSNVSIFNYPSLDAPVVYHKGLLITQRQLLHLLEYLSEQIPSHQYFLNLYEDRFYFLIGFLLGIKQRRISLFPSTVTEHTLQQLRKSYTDILILSEHDQTDHELYGSGYENFSLKSWVEHFFSAKSASDVPDFDFSNSDFSNIGLSNIDVQQQVAIIFTSGSTGQPKPYMKQWGDLAVVGHSLMKAFLPEKNKANQTIENKDKLFAVLATVPPQHMYGLESSILFALQNGLLIHSERPFFPQDIAHCLEELQEAANNKDCLIDTSLITTPLHLKACVKTNVALPGVKRFISATAPLDAELAQVCETMYSAPVLEIYGCTEVGSIAWRKSTESEQWTVFDDIHLKEIESDDASDVQVNTTRSIKQFVLNDYVELLDKQHFLLKGRKEDLINLAGKRSSMAYLNHHLQSCDVLSDACYYLDAVQKGINTSSRLIAFVVPLITTGQSNKQGSQQAIQLIREHLKSRIDPVFLPKRIYFVSDLPRNATGKLPHSELKKFLTQIESNP